MKKVSPKTQKKKTQKTLALAQIAFGMKVFLQNFRIYDLILILKILK